MKRLLVLPALFLFGQVLFAAPSALPVNSEAGCECSALPPGEFPWQLSQQRRSQYIQLVDVLKGEATLTLFGINGVVIGNWHLSAREKRTAVRIDSLKPGVYILADAEGNSLRFEVK